jgi:hypothetical protein
MSVVRVDALCECDGCQARFGVEIDLAREFKDFSNFDHMVREEVLNGNGTYYRWAVRGKMTVDRVRMQAAPTIQGGFLLCDNCSIKCDAMPGDDDLTREQVLAALSLPVEERDDT